MFLRTLVLLAIGVVMFAVGILAAPSRSTAPQPVSLQAAPRHSAYTQTNSLRYNEYQGPESPDPIAGDWDASFEVEGTTTPATFSFKVDGEKVTGEVYSAHTGPGTINGSWAKNKLEIKMDFAAHESIALTGELKDGKLVGEFRTEGFVSKWHAQRRVEAPSSTATSKTTTPAADSADPLSGEWEGNLESQGTRAPITFKFKLEGDKVTGVSASDHLGAGALNNGSWKANKLSFNLSGNFGVIALSGELHDGKLTGEWNLTGKEMKGTWEAKKK